MEIDLEVKQKALSLGITLEKILETPFNATWVRLERLNEFIK